jgi:hypothetical protein
MRVAIAIKSARCRMRTAIPRTVFEKKTFSDFDDATTQNFAWRPWLTKKSPLSVASGSDQLDSIEHLFTATINWRRIEEHHPAFMRLALAIHSGKLAPSAVLARIDSHSSPVGLFT